MKEIYETIDGKFIKISDISAISDIDIKSERLPSNNKQILNISIFKYTIYFKKGHILIVSDIKNWFIKSENSFEEYQKELEKMIKPIKEGRKKLIDLWFKYFNNELNENIEPPQYEIVSESWEI